MRKESNIRSKPTKILKLKAQTYFYIQSKAEGERNRHILVKALLLSYVYKVYSCLFATNREKWFYLRNRKEQKQNKKKIIIKFQKQFF
jgi:hypothetical protein